MRQRAVVVRSRNLAFTANYSTRFPEYIRLHLPVPEALSNQYFRWFHNGASGSMVATPSLARGLKNLKAFLSLPVEGTKVVVGDGPALGALRNKFPEAVFDGEKPGPESTEHYASAEVFVFPSKPDTHGLVQQESLACGTPVAAFYPVTGPVDVVRKGSNIGALDEDLASAVARALNREDCRRYALVYSWEHCTRTLVGQLRSNQANWNRTTLRNNLHQASR